MPGSCKILEKDGIRATVVNCSTIKPLDQETILKVAKKTGAIVTVEEHSILGGLGGAVSEFLSEAYPVRIHRMGVRDEFGQSAPAEVLLRHYKLMPEDIAAQALEWVKKK
jgi:transketolase